MKHTNPTFIGNPYECQPDFPQQKWLVVKNDELKKKPYKANGFCFVTTNGQEDEYTLHLHFLKTGMLAYLFPLCKGYFENRLDFSTLEILDTNAFIKKYPHGLVN